MSSTPEQYESLFNQNIVLSNQFNELIQEYKNRSLSINETINELVNRVNILITNMGSSVFSPVELFFDRSTIYSKDSLQISLDLKDSTLSNWVKLSDDEDSNNTFEEGSFTIVHPVRVQSLSPGQYETVPYTLDHSNTKVQFIVANNNANSDQINCEVENSMINLNNRGNSITSMRSFSCHTINIVGMNQDKTLFVRFINEGLNNTSAQDIIPYGGNTSFKLDKVCNYPEMKY